SGEIQARAAAVDPALVPAPVGAVVHGQALAAEAAVAGPVLEQGAAGGDRFDPAVAGLLAIGQEHLPLAEPEVELAVLGGLARGRRGRRRRLRHGNAEG